MRAWASDGIAPLAIFTSAPHGDSPASLHGKALRAVAGADDALTARLRPLPLLLVRMDTRGRLEAMLCAPGPTGMTELPLTLLEDGHLYRPGHKG